MRRCWIENSDGRVSLVVTTPVGGAVDYRIDLTELDHEDVPSGLYDMVRDRLRSGAREYGRVGVDLAPPEIDRETREELADAIGWALLGDHPMKREIIMVITALWRVMDEDADD